MAYGVIKYMVLSPPDPLSDSKVRVLLGCLQMLDALLDWYQEGTHCVDISQNEQSGSQVTQRNTSVLAFHEEQAQCQ